MAKLKHSHVRGIDGSVDGIHEVLLSIHPTRLERLENVMAELYKKVSLSRAAVERFDE